jgi:hypothetical protein
MSATIRIQGHEATITEGEWTSDSSDLLAQIVEVASQYLPDGAQAREVVAALGGVLIREDDPGDSLDDDGEEMIH